MGFYIYTRNLYTSKDQSVATSGVTSEVAYIGDGETVKLHFDTASASTVTIQVSFDEGRVNSITTWSTNSVVVGGNNKTVDLSAAGRWVRCQSSVTNTRATLFQQVRTS